MASISQPNITIIQSGGGSELPVTITDAGGYSQISGLDGSSYRIFGEHNEYGTIELVSGSYDITNKSNGDAQLRMDSSSENSITLYWGAEGGSREGSYVTWICHPTSHLTKYFNMNLYLCLLEGTLITLANGFRIPIEEVKYSDELLVWDFDNGRFGSAKPLTISRPQKARCWKKVTFSNGSELKQVGHHRIFSLDQSRFVYPKDAIGDLCLTEDGSAAILKSVEFVDESAMYYNIRTDYHMNLFAEGILTSFRFNNLYPIQGLKFVKEPRGYNVKPFIEAGIPEKYITGFRLAELPPEIYADGENHGNSNLEYIQNILKECKPNA